MKESVEQVVQLLDILERYPLSAFTTLIGLILCYISLRKSLSDPECRPNFYGLVLGLAIVIASQAVSIANIYIARRVPTTQAFENLKNNSRAKWVIRLIPYYHNPASESPLSLNALKSIGDPKHDFVFVADYEELVNYTVKEAIYKTGGIIQGKNRVSAIIFPLMEHNLYPASARGILQVINKVDDRHKNDENYMPFDLIDKNKLGKDQVEDLYENNINSYSWIEYNKYYTEYSELVKKFKQGKYSAKDYIGSLNRDWHPTGYSQIIGMESPKTNLPSFFLSSYSVKGKENIVLPNFGARAFLIENLEIASIDHRLMCDFKYILPCCDLPFLTFV